MRLLSLILLVNLTGILGIGDVAHKQPLSDELIEFINNEKNITWKAGKNRRFRTVEDLRRMLGTRREPSHLKEKRRPTVTHENVILNLPQEFDARKQWPKCQTISQIRDQSSCGSCWAFGAVTAMSDRVCIHSNQAYINTQLSATDLLSCCKSCGAGCFGGWVGSAWDFWRDHGIVTGGLFADNSTCLPYPFEPCEHHGQEGELPPCAKKLYPTPKCADSCQESYTRKSFLEDKTYAISSYNLLRTQETIQKEIYLNGPVEAAMNVYADFGNYKLGVYIHKTGELLGGHAVRLLGWGVTEDRTPFWIVANSWNKDWGEDGFFRILRGYDHCGIESDVAGGIPKIIL